MERRGEGKHEVQALCSVERIRTDQPLASAFHTQRTAGFTLLELMIALLLMSTLVALAVPSYQSYLLRSHRAAAIEQLLAASACQQLVYASRFSFDTLQCGNSDNERYGYRFEPEGVASSTVFSVIASPRGAQREDRCGELILDHTGARRISGPTEIARKCWESR